MTHHIPDEIINKIVLMARPKHFYIRHLTNIGEIVAYKTEQGNGNCRVIDYMANVAYWKRLGKLKTNKHYQIIRQLRRLIKGYIIDTKIDYDFEDMCLGEWFKWWIYEDRAYITDV